MTDNQEGCMAYDSTEDTTKHINEVRNNIRLFCHDLIKRGINHDRSKLEPEEKPYFDEYTPLLSSVTYGSDEYRAMLRQMKPAIDHHQKSNRHHPEYFEDGISGMNIVDLVEMLCDWMAAVKRHDDGDIRRSIRINQERFNLDPQIVHIMLNTVDAYDGKEMDGF